MSNLNTPTLVVGLEQAKPEFQALVNLNCQDSSKAVAIVQQELEFLKEIALTNPSLLNCTPESAVLAVKRAMKNNLTLDPQAGLIYVKTRNVNTGTQTAPVWTTIMETQETANGIISKLRMFGRILDVKRPSVEYDANGKVFSVTIEWMVPSTPQPRWESATFTDYEFSKWRAASHREKSRGKNDAASKDYSNPLYSSWKGGIDAEFARAKAIRHALKKLGANANEGFAKAIQVEPIQVIDTTTAKIEAMTHTDDTAAVYVTTHEVVQTPTQSTINSNETIL